MHDTLTTTTKVPLEQPAGGAPKERGPAAQFEDGLVDRAEVSCSLAAPAGPEPEDNEAPRKPRRNDAESSVNFDLAAEPLGDEETPPPVAADGDVASALADFDWFDYEPAAADEQP